MQNDTPKRVRSVANVPPYVCRPLAEIKKAWAEGFWIPREEEAILIRSRAKPPAARVLKKTPKTLRSEYTA